MRRICGAATLIACFAAGGAQAADRAGAVDEIGGDVIAVLDGIERVLAEDADVFSGDRIMTRDDANVLLRFLDDTTLALGESGEVTIDEFVFSPGGGGSFAATMTQGVFRYLSGQIAAQDPRRVGLRTPFATIGVRGTSILTRVGDGPDLVILLEEDAPKRPPSIQVANTGGAVLIDQPEFGTEIAGPGVAPTPPRRYNLRVINSLTRTLGRVTNRLRRPGFR